MIYYFIDNINISDPLFHICNMLYVDIYNMLYVDNKQYIIVNI